MNIEKRFSFDGFDIDKENASIVFKYSISGSGEKNCFEERLSFPKEGFDLDIIPSEMLKEILNSLSLAIGISYWKMYCPSNIDLGNIFLTKKQAEFWDKVYTDGLGEFYYVNKIDPRDLISFPFKEGLKKEVPAGFKRENRSLILFGGGKDSIVSVELMKKFNKEFELTYVNDDHVKKGVVELTGKEPFVIKRIIDEKLIDLSSREDVNNGHVPVSLIWAFVYLFVAAVYDFKYIITSNEKSADFGNLKYLGKEINHQWSKSWEAEKIFNDYIEDFITPEINYFSILRPFSEFKIAKLFSEHEKYFLKFSSCNANFRIDRKLENSLWCKECPKCVFVFTLLSAFLPKKELINVFGENIYEKKELLSVFDKLLGLKGHKPLECVGTPVEMMIAMRMAFRNDDYKNDEIIKYYKDSLSSEADDQSLEGALFSNSSDHSIPDEFNELIR